MPGDKFYRTAQWRLIRGHVLARDRWTCVVPGCGRKATIVDHIVARRDGGSNHPSNLRSLCVQHDGQVKELPSRERMNRGELRAFGCDVRGNPLDPDHPWNRR
jgi:5-methylcytosine-specific restriction endonuclease McrA